MKIKITRNIPVEKRCKPIVGETYEVIEQQKQSPGGLLYFIKVNGERVGIYHKECEVVEA